MVMEIIPGPNLILPASIVSASSVGLNVTSSPYNAVGNGAANDTAAIQSAFDSGAPSVYVPDGTYLVTGLDPPPTLRRWWGPGRIKQTGSTSTGLIIPSTPPEDLIIDGLTFEANENINTFYMECANTRITNCIFDGATGCHVTLLNSSYAKIDNCLFSGDYINWSIHIEGCSYVDIADNRIVRPSGSSHGIWINLSNGCTARDNLISGLGSVGFGIALIDCNRSGIFNNLIYNAQLEAIGVDSITVDAQGNIVSGNLCFFDNGVSQDYGMHVYGNTNGFQCIENTVSGNFITRAGKTAIAMIGEGLNNYVIGNTINNPNTLGGSNPTPLLSNGIEIGDNCDGTVVAHNLIFDGGGNMTYGVREFSGPTGTLVHDNSIAGAQTADTLVTGTGSKVFQSPQTFPFLAWVQYVPTIATTGVALGSVTVNDCFYNVGENQITAYIDFTITSVGSGSGSLTATLPNDAALINFGSGQTSSFVPLVVSGGELIGSTAGKVAIQKYDGTTLLAATHYRLQITYQPA